MIAEDSKTYDRIIYELVIILPMFEIQCRFWIDI